MMIYDEIAESVVRGDQTAVEDLTQRAMDEDIDLEKIIYDGLIRGMNTVAAKWKAGDLYVPEVLIASRAMKGGMAIIAPHMEKKTETIGTIVLGTVKGDIHNIGKNLVGLMMEGAGFKVVDVGTNVDKKVFVKSVQENSAMILGLSALLTTTLPYMEEVISEFDNSLMRDGVKIMVGGAPVNQKFADSIGADGYAENAAIAVEKAKELLGT